MIKIMKLNGSTECRALAACVVHTPIRALQWYSNNVRLDAIVIIRSSTSWLSSNIPLSVHALYLYTTFSRICKPSNDADNSYN